MYAYDKSWWNKNLTVNVIDPIMEHVRAGRRGAFQVNAHIYAPGLFQSEFRLDEFRDDLAAHGKAVQVDIRLTPR